MKVYPPLPPRTSSTSRGAVLTGAGSTERIYTYTIITTSSAKSVSFLHDRMPVIVEPDSDALRKWLDPNEGWSTDLANLLKAYEGRLLWYLPSANGC